MKSSFNRFSIKIWTRIILLCAACFLLAYLLWVDQNYFRSIYAFAFLLFLAVELVFFIKKVYRDYNTFLLSLLNDDFSTRFREKGPSEINKYYKTLNAITNKFQSISLKKEEEHNLLDQLVKQVGIGIIIVDSRDQVVMMNRAFTSLTGQMGFHSIQGLKKHSKELADLISNISPGEKRLIKMTSGENIRQLSIQCTLFKSSEHQLKLVSAQDIKKELEIHEWQAWHKLIRVLTHEIMNSVTPILSLSETLTNRLSRTEDEDKKLVSGLEAIKNRSRGLLKFTQDYRKLTKIPKPEFKEITLKNLFGNIEVLLRELVDRETTIMSFEINNATEKVLVDEDMMQGVFINLVKNALEACEGFTDKPKITIRAFKQKDGTIRMEVVDNGPGVDDQHKEQLFIPFFTTKPDGSGIGLSICRQIIQQHHGNLRLYNKDPGTVAEIII